MKKGLYANIHAKRKRGATMRKKGDAGAPTEQNFKDAAKTAKAMGGMKMKNYAGGGRYAKGGDFGMLSVKAGIDNNPKPTQADRIAGATKGKKMMYGGKMKKAMGGMKMKYKHGGSHRQLD
tara:strand:+ start:374 stop:736 length:363 start_codon:yes stop_codon:yes gene_type:complete